MPKLLQELQVFEEERVENTTKYLTKLVEFEETLGPAHTESVSKMKSKILLINGQADLDNFVEQNKPKNPPPARAQYIGYNQTSGPSIPSSPNGEKKVATKEKTKKKKSTKSLGLSRNNSKKDVTSPRITHSPSAKEISTPTTPKSQERVLKIEVPEKTVPTEKVELKKPTVTINPAEVDVVKKEPVKEEQPPPPPVPEREMEKREEVKPQLMVRSIYDYDATEDNELSMKEGDIITLLYQDETGWWEGRNSQGKVGIFPSNFVEMIGNESKKPTGPIAPDTKCKVLYDYTAEDETELTINEGDILRIQHEEEGWYFGTNERGQSGNFPSNYVTLLQ
eukprot:TRINITY_DN2075_c0_g1_i1.p1 TRINITY_DN2075_c0_g1~~TRINITY_DN2075_c0_g1_i1.p1  ORF type:complete len:337 (-),score=75.64 TRINITY_DN2075_c0_g1_i1:91-1101(-)